MPKIVLDQINARVGSSYPQPFRLASANRRKLALGDAAGLTQFGVNLTRLPPNEVSSQRHWHSHEDELVFVLEGALVMITDAGEEQLGPGDCAAFRAGVPDGHQFVNRAAVDAVYVEVGGRNVADVCTYPDVDLHSTEAGFTRKDGTAYRRGE